MTIRKSRGFTLIELLVVIAIIALLIGILLPALGKARKNAQQLKDGTQVRGIMQAMVNWAADNKNSFPLPSVADANGKTVGLNSANPRKNRTGSILSLLVFQQSITPELCVSTGEVARVIVKTDYQFSNPDTVGAASTDAKYAVYDPSFVGSPQDDLTQDGVNVNAQQTDFPSNNSYAHNCVAGARKVNWAATLSSSTPMFGNRGPVYEGAEDGVGTIPTDGVWRLAPGRQGVASETLFIHGTETKWEGNVAFGDVHVEFLQEPNPETATFQRRQQGATEPVNERDNLFVDETNEGVDANDHKSRRNAYLRIWRTGIPVNEEFDVRFLNPEDEFVWVDGRAN